MTSIIKGCFIAILVALPSLANATFFQQEYDQSERHNFGWSRADGAAQSPHPLLSRLFDRKSELPAWEEWESDKALRLPRLIMGIVGFMREYDFTAYHHDRDWSKCHTSEVPVPAALPLFSMALISLGLFKRRS